MNEQRNKRMEYIYKKSDPLQENWESLIARLLSLESTAKVLGRYDLIKPIGDKTKALQKNKPNKKIYRAIVAFVEKLESELGNGIGRTRY